MPTVIQRQESLVTNTEHKAANLLAILLNHGAIPAYLRERATEIVEEYEAVLMQHQLSVFREWSVKYMGATERKPS